MSKRATVLVIIISGLLLAALIMRHSTVAWLSLPFLIYWGAGIAFAPVTEEIRLTARRTVRVIAQGISAEIEVEVIVINEGAKKLYLQLRDPLFPGMSIISGQPRQQFIVYPGEEAGLTYTCETGRGIFHWEHVSVITTDPFGLVENEIQIAAVAGITIYPQFKKSRAFTLYPWRTLPAPGFVPARTGGSGTDFFGVRDYHPGDPLKTLDWRLTARYPHRFFTKEFVQEKTADILLLLDARCRTNIVAGKEDLFEWQVRATASLAEMFLRQGQRVGLQVFGESIVRQSPAYGKVQLKRIWDCLAGIKVGLHDKHYQVIHALPVSRLPRSTVLIVISPFDADDKAFYQKLRALGFQVILVAADTFDFANTFSGSLFGQDGLSSFALAAARLERRFHLDMVARYAVSVIDWQVSDPLAARIHSILGRSLGVRKI